MADEPQVSRSEFVTAIERIVKLETHNDIQNDNITRLWSRIDDLVVKMEDGFKSISDKIGKLNNWRSWAAFGLVVSGTALGNTVYRIIAAQFQ